MKFLVIQLYSPLMSWGEVAVGGERRSASHVSRSTIQGLLGAALGIDRSDEDAQVKLKESFKMGTQEILAGESLKDYHTAEVPTRDLKFTPHTRRDELYSFSSSPNTILSSREYRVDSFHLVVIEECEEAFYSVELLKDALQNPKFHLYFGRKSCPLGMPLNPKIIESDYAENALEIYWKTLVERYKKSFKDFVKRSKVDSTKFYWELGLNTQMKAVLETTRYDKVIHNSRRQFGPRKELMAYLGKPEFGGESNVFE